MESRQDKNSFGTAVAITSADFTCPCDGYFVAYLTTASGQYNMIVNTVNVVVSNGGWNRDTLFVKKGMVIRLVVDSGQAGGSFIPLE